MGSTATQAENPIPSGRKGKCSYGGEMSERSTELIEIPCQMKSINPLCSPYSPPFAFQASAPCPGKCQFNDQMKPRKEVVFLTKRSLSKASLCREHTQVRNYPRAGAQKVCVWGTARNCPSILQQWPSPLCTHTQQSNYFSQSKG